MVVLKYRLFLHGIFYTVLYLVGHFLGLEVHKAARVLPVFKDNFDSLELKKLPSIQSLKQEYAALLAENKKLYPDQKKAKAEMMELLTTRHNTSRILGLTEDEKQQEQRQEER